MTGDSFAHAKEVTGRCVRFIAWLGESLEGLAIDMLDLKGFNVDILKTRDIVGVMGVITIGAIKMSMDPASLTEIVRCRFFTKFVRDKRFFA